MCIAQRAGHQRVEALEGSADILHRLATVLHDVHVALVIAQPLGVDALAPRAIDQAECIVVICLPRARQLRFLPQGKVLLPGDPHGVLAGLAQLFDARRAATLAGVPRQDDLHAGVLAIEHLLQESSRVLVHRTALALNPILGLAHHRGPVQTQIILQCCPAADLMGLQLFIGGRGADQRRYLLVDEHLRALLRELLRVGIMHGARNVVDLWLRQTLAGIEDSLFHLVLDVIGIDGAVESAHETEALPVTGFDDAVRLRIQHRRFRHAAPQTENAGHGRGCELCQLEAVRGALDGTDAR